MLLPIRGSMALILYLGYFVSVPIKYVEGRGLTAYSYFL